MLSSVMQFFNGGIKVARLLVGLKAGLTAGASGIANAVASGDVAGVFTTVGSSGTGKMPPWQPGRLALVWNQGANTMTLYSAEGATIPTGLAQKVQFTGATGTKTAGDTGISVVSGSFYLFVGSYDATGAYPVWNLAAFGQSAGAFNGSVGATTPNTGAFTTLSASGTATMAEVDATKVVSTGVVSGTFLDGSAADAISSAGSGQSDATALTAAVNRISTVSATTTGVKLPPIATVGVGGMVMVQNNDGTNACHVYSAGSETIDTQTGSTGVTLSHAKSAIFFAVTSAKWISIGGVFSA
ncbi:MAG: hypothetical protein ACHRHE_15665 [Tepidisphaerales bacterium]